MAIDKHEKPGGRHGVFTPGRWFAGGNTDQRVFGKRVEYSPDLTPGSWSPLSGGNAGGDGFDAVVTDTNALARP
jgi:hypothetical protein